MAKSRFENILLHFQNILLVSSFCPSFRADSPRLIPFGSVSLTVCDAILALFPASWSRSKSATLRTFTSWKSHRTLWGVTVIVMPDMFKTRTGSRWYDPTLSKFAIRGHTPDLPVAVSSFSDVTADSAFFIYLTNPEKFTVLIGSNSTLNLSVDMTNPTNQLCKEIKAFRHSMENSHLYIEPLSLLLSHLFLIEVGLENLSCIWNHEIKHLYRFGLKKQKQLYCNFNPHLPSGLFHLYQLAESISSFRGVWYTYSFLFNFNRNSCKQRV